jgi:hypothetical protein
MPTMLNSQVFFSFDCPNASTQGSKQMEISKPRKTVSFIDTPFGKSTMKIEDRGSKIAALSSILDLQSSVLIASPVSPPDA